MYKKLNWEETNLEKLSNGELKKLGDYWLRQYLLKNTERKNNKIFCPLKKQWFIEDKIHCCHFIDRSVMHLRYDLNNVHLLSMYSNTFDSQIIVEGYKSKHHKDYEDYLIEKIGKKEFQNILESSTKLRIFAQQDYIEAINRFRNGN